MSCHTVFAVLASQPAGAGHPWFALRVRTGGEKTAACILGEMGYEHFLPMYSGRRRWSDRVKKVDLPLFPGYVFSRFDVENRLPVLKIPGVIHIVGVGRTPVPVDSGEIAAIRVIVSSGLPAQPWPFLRVGDAVLIEEGPLRGVEGVVIEVTKRCRLIALITLLQRAVAVEIEREWVRPIGHNRVHLQPPAAPPMGEAVGWGLRSRFPGHPPRCA